MDKPLIFYCFVDQNYRVNQQNCRCSPTHRHTSGTGLSASGAFLLLGFLAYNYQKPLNYLSLQLLFWAGDPQSRPLLAKGQQRLWQRLWGEGSPRCCVPAAVWAVSWWLLMPLLCLPKCLDGSIHFQTCPYTIVGKDSLGLWLEIIVTELGNLWLFLRVVQLFNKCLSFLYLPPATCWK